MEKFDLIGVVGCGLMGAGIAEVCARAGKNVIVVEESPNGALLGQKRIDASLLRAEQRGKIESARLVQDRIQVVNDLDALADRDLVIEAIVEDVAAKLAVFSRLDKVVTNPDAVLATNTSSIPVMKLAVATNRPEKVMGDVETLGELAQEGHTTAGSVRVTVIERERLVRIRPRAHRDWPGHHLCRAGRGRAVKMHGSASRHRLVGPPAAPHVLFLRGGRRRPAVDPVDLRGRMPQRPPDLIDSKLDDGPLLPLAGLEAALLQATLRDDARAPLQRLGGVLGCRSPQGTAQEQRLAIFPLPRTAVERPRCRGDRERCDRRTGRGVSDLGISGQIPDHGGDRFASHRWASSPQRPGTCRPTAWDCCCIDSSARCRASVVTTGAVPLMSATGRYGGIVASQSFMSR
jgi:hypothetical protein